MNLITSPLHQYTETLLLEAFPAELSGGLLLATKGGMTRRTPFLTILLIFPLF